MPKVPMKILLDDAAGKNYGIGAYAISNMEQIQGIVEAACRNRSPLIIMVSKKSLKYSSYLPYMIDAAIKENPGIPIAMHLDHGSSFNMCREAVDFGFSSVMIDGTFDDEGKPASFDHNMQITRKVVEYAHERGVSVEGEIGVIGGKEDDLDINIQRFTDPGKVGEFVEFTGVDALAVSIGNIHGLNKFGGEKKIRLDILAEVNRIIPEMPLVLHGASSLPAKYVRKISKYGGKLHNVRGVPVAQIQKAIKLGIRKINIYTDLTLCMAAGLREFLLKNPGVIDPRKYLGISVKEIIKMVSGKIEKFGSKNRAAGILKSYKEDPGQY